MTMPDLAVLFALAASSPSPHAAMASPKDPNLECLRCHRMATMAYRDERTGRVVSLAVDPAAFAASNHRKLACTRCHSREFRWYPHPAETAGERLRCLDCHRDDPKLRARGFPAIGREVAASVHVRRMGKRFDCFACHDPHSFRLAGADAPSLVAASNAVCLGCHAGRRRTAAPAARALAALAAKHDWLPNVALHWRTVRCLDCHLGDRASTDTRDTPRAAQGHRIVPADEAVRDCVGCHSRNSILFTRLYRHTAKESRAARGFVNAALLNDAYVVGATRNMAVDRVALAVLGLALAAIAGHAWLRWRLRPGLASRRSRR
ncbi:MAG: cytochrome c3 family protein [Candidatus Coatesbacteria bacterium]